MASKQTMKTRYAFIDNIKLFALILVVLLHMLTALCQDGIVHQSNFFYVFYCSTYTYHVALFFVCSGFLYQVSNKVHDINSWWKNVLDKLLNLGVPFITFTLVTLLFKTIAANDVNNKASGIIDALFVNPIAPYWYLYVLFLFFVITPCFSKISANIISTIIALVLKTVYTFYLSNFELPYFITAIFSWWVWFNLGMLFSKIDFNKIPKFVKCIFLLLIIPAGVLSNIFFGSDWKSDLTENYICSLLFVLFFIFFFRMVNIEQINKISFKLNKYIMPIFLMHTIFAAGARIVLIKVGITNVVIHITVGLIASFVVPALVYFIMEKIPYISFLIYPKNEIKKIRGKHEHKIQN